MPGVFVVTDSSSDLTPEEVAPFDVEIVPLTVRFGSEEFTDGVDLTIDDFYRRMADSEELPQTACPSPGAFAAAFRPARFELCGDAVQRFIPGDAAEIAAAARSGADLDAVMAQVDDLVPRTRVFATLNTLENLRKGGRIGGAKAMVGSMLSIKPLIDITGGTVREAGKARTRRRAMQMLYEQMTTAGAIEKVAVMHGKAPDIQDFLDLIAPHFSRASIRLGVLGAVIGVHGGAEILGVSWIGGA